jgi:hypothetical protein
MSGYKNMHQKTMHLKEVKHVEVLAFLSQNKEGKKRKKREINLHAQNLLTILGSMMVNIKGRSYKTIQYER